MRREIRLELCVDGDPRSLVCSRRRRRARRSPRSCATGSTSDSGRPTTCAGQPPRSRRGRTSHRSTDGREASAGCARCDRLRAPPRQCWSPGSTARRTTTVASGLAAGYRGAPGARRGQRYRPGVEQSLGLEAAVGEDGAWVVRPAPQITGLSVVTGLGEDGTSAAEIEGASTRCAAVRRGDRGARAARWRRSLDVATSSTPSSSSSARLVADPRSPQWCRTCEAGGSVVGSVLVARS
jgi:hypothetical protein